jgi:hypothetical protein
VLNDVELAAEAARGPERTLVVTVGFGPGAALVEPTPA